jgi:hypothetical protein
MHKLCIFSGLWARAGFGGRAVYAQAHTRRLVFTIKHMLEPVFGRKFTIKHMRFTIKHMARNGALCA